MQGKLTQYGLRIQKGEVTFLGIISMQGKCTCNRRYSSEGTTDLSAEGTTDLSVEGTPDLSAEGITDL